MHRLEEDVRTLLVVKAKELFADYQLTCVEHDQPTETADPLVGVLGFAGEHLSGAVMMTANREAIAASNPVGDGVTRGWIAELVNQIVGRLKNGLLRYGVEVWLSVPVVLTATRLVPLPNAAVRPIYLLVGAGQISLWLELDGDAQFTDEVLEGAAEREGKTLLF